MNCCRAPQASRDPNSRAGGTGNQRRDHVESRRRTEQNQGGEPPRYWMGRQADVGWGSRSPRWLEWQGNVPHLGDGCSARQQPVYFDVDRPGPLAARLALFTGRSAGDGLGIRIQGRRGRHPSPAGLPRSRLSVVTFSRSIRGTWIETGQTGESKMSYGTTPQAGAPTSNLSVTDHAASLDSIIGDLGSLADRLTELGGRVHGMPLAAVGNGKSNSAPEPAVPVLVRLDRKRNQIQSTINHMSDLIAGIESAL